MPYFTVLDTESKSFSRPKDPGSVEKIPLELNGPRMLEEPISSLKDHILRNLRRIIL